MISYVKVLNTVAALGADAPIDNEGYLSVAGADSIFTRDIKSMTSQAYVAEVLQSTTIQITSVGNSTTYQWLIPGAVEYTTGVPKPVVATVVSDATATVNEVASALNDFLVGLGGAYNFTSTVATDTVTIVARTGYPIYGTPVQIGASTSTITVGTAGVWGVGLGSQLAKKYDADSYPEMANIVSTNQYTEWQIRYNDNAVKGAAVTYGVNDKTLVILVNQGSTAANVWALQGSGFGVLDGLKKGYKVTVTAASADAAVANGVVTIATDVFYGNTDTNIGLEAGDIISVNRVAYPIASILTGATAATYGTPNDQSTAATLYAKYRSLPL